MLEFKINEYITLKSEKEYTEIYLLGKRFIQCKYLLLNIPIDGSDKSIMNIDEAAKLYGHNLEYNKNKFLIKPEEEFYGHCSNLQMFAECDYHPELLHSNLAVPILKRLVLYDKKIFISLLWHLDNMFMRYKTVDRKKFLFCTFWWLVESCIEKYDFPIEEQNASIFIRTFKTLQILNNIGRYMKQHGFFLELIRAILEVGLPNFVNYIKIKSIRLLKNSNSGYLMNKWLHFFTYGELVSLFNESNVKNQLFLSILVIQFWQPIPLILL